MRILLIVVLGILISGCSILQERRDSINNLPTSSCNLASSRKLILLDNPCSRTGIVDEMQLNGKVDAGGVDSMSVSFFLNDNLVETRQISFKKNIASTTYKPFLEYLKLKGKVDRMLLEAYDASLETVDQLDVILTP